MKLRPYQQRAVAHVTEAWREGARSVLLVMATGAGKTQTFTHLEGEAVRSGGSGLILVHRRELATQACNRLRDFGIDFGLIMNGEHERPHAPVQVATVQTLVRRMGGWVGPFLKRVKLAVADEAHLSVAETWRVALAACPNALILGATATPYRISGKSLASQYDALVVGATPRELRELGALCPFVGYGYHRPNLEQQLAEVKSTGGDYNEAQLGEIMSGSVIVGGIVERWLETASNLSTVAFCSTVKNSLELTEAFRKRGVAAEHIDGNTPTAQREAVLKRVEAGITRVLCNVGIAVEGLDIPRLKCCIDAAPTKSLARAIQKWGRVRRPWADCRSCGISDAPEGGRCKHCGSGNLFLYTARLHDHSFNVAAHGLPDDERDYSLDARKTKPKPLSQCGQCFAWFAGATCSCGSEEKAWSNPEAKERAVREIADAEEFLFDSSTKLPEPPRPPIQVRWDAPKTITGKLLKKWVEKTGYGEGKRYLIDDGERERILPGTTRLDALLWKIPDESLVRVAFTGETELGGGRRRKEFDVEMDDGL